MKISTSLQAILGFTVAVLVQNSQQMVIHTKGVCEDLLPVHPDGNNGTIPPQSTPPPYEVIPSTLRVEQGGNMTVVLYSKTGVTFRGFHIQARAVENNNTIIGKWVAIPEATKINDCQGSSDTVVHDLTEIKPLGMAFVWQAPTNFIGKITFRATVAQDYYFYWVGFKTAEVEVLKL